MIKIGSIVVGKCPKCGNIYAGYVVIETSEILNHRRILAEEIGEIVLTGGDVEVLAPGSQVKLSLCEHMKGRP